jgi:hypothetical protein
MNEALYFRQLIIWDILWEKYDNLKFTVMKSVRGTAFSVTHTRSERLVCKEEDTFICVIKVKLKCVLQSILHIQSAT